EPSPGRIWVYDTETGRRLGQIGVNAVLAGKWAPDGRLWASADNSTGRSRIWNVPARRPLTWLLTIAAAIAVLLSLLARWRVRRLAPAAAFGGPLGSVPHTLVSKGSSRAVT